MIKTDEQICTEILKEVIATNERQGKVDVFFEYAPHVNAVTVYSFNNDNYADAENSEVLFSTNLYLNYRNEELSEIFKVDFKNKLDEIYKYLKSL